MVEALSPLAGQDKPSPTLNALPTWEGRQILVVVETPKGLGNKLKFDSNISAFRLSKVLPAGMVFPFDFGFVPGTLAEDGDPLDVLVLMDSPVHPGCVVLSRPIGVLECEQSKTGEPIERNDRVIAVAAESAVHREARTLRDLSPALLRGIEAFFVNYSRESGKVFRVVRRRGAMAATATVRRAVRLARARATEASE